MAVERSFPASPVPLTGGKVLATPFQFYVTGEDKLVLVTWSSKVCVVAVEGRWWSAAGGIEAFRHTFTTNGTLQAEAHAMNVQAGFLLNCALTVASPVTFAGECFAQLVIGRGGGSTFIKLGIVLQGYIGTAKFLGFPGSPLEDSMSGSGAYQWAAVAAPAAATDWTWIPLQSKHYRIRSVVALLTASAVVANRIVALECSNGVDLRMFRLAPGYLQPASVVGVYTWAPGVANVSADNTQAVNVSAINEWDIEFPFRIASLTRNFQAGDQWSQITLTWNEWLVTDTTAPFIL